ncbi:MULTISPECIES: alpha/beta hydrolase [Exiguobacterium]|uniref:alpha/beta hydrolase n=1 Tax=Exiguobacterium TaxID=33986 RepID=UPI001BEA9521|nr:MULTISPECIES: alpha/beta fold hydrolase [Exiguobacterium]MCT4784209.1 alpha/beta fold hydrolase [Exiguobacterium himgiriensis]
MAKTYPVIPGAGSFYYEGNEIGILLCHGFNGTPQSVHEVGLDLMESGFTVYAPRLAGHGTDPEDFRRSTRDDWYETVVEGVRLLRERCCRVMVVGQSMGGTLALKAALAGHVDAVVTINAALSVPGYACHAADGVCRFIDEDAPDISAKGVHEIVYHKVPTSAIRQLLALIEEVRPRVSHVSVPTYVIHSAIDHVVPPEDSIWLYEQVAGSKERAVLERSYHVATMDNDRERLSGLIASYCEQVASVLNV